MVVLRVVRYSSVLDVMRETTWLFQGPRDTVL